MPRPAHSALAVQVTRLRILDASTELLCAEGFDGFSMRKLAKRLSMTVANIYNYSYYYNFHDDDNNDYNDDYYYHSDYYFRGDEPTLPNFLSGSSGRPDAGTFFC